MSRLRFQPGDLALVINSDVGNTGCQCEILAFATDSYKGFKPPPFGDYIASVPSNPAPHPTGAWCFNDRDLMPLSPDESQFREEKEEMEV